MNSRRFGSRDSADLDPWTETKILIPDWPRRAALFIPFCFLKIRLRKIRLTHGAPRALCQSMYVNCMVPVQNYTPDQALNSPIRGSNRGPPTVQSQFLGHRSESWPGGPSDRRSCCSRQQRDFWPPLYAATHNCFSQLAQRPPILFPDNTNRPLKTPLRHT